MQHYESDIFTLCDLESHYKVVQVRFFVLTEKCVKNFYAFILFLLQHTHQIHIEQIFTPISITF